MKSKNKSKPKPKAKPKHRDKSTATPRSKQALLQEIEELKSRMEEQEETLRAIRDGEVDALMVSTPEGEKVFTLKGAEQVYRIFIETMHEGALLLSPAGTVLYANTRFAEMVSMPLEGIINSPLDRYMRASDRAGFKGLLEEGMQEQANGEINLRRGRGQYLAARISVAPFSVEGVPCVSAVVTDISEIQKYLEIIEASRLAQSVIEQSTDCIVVCDTQGIIHASSSSSSSSSSIHRYYSGRVRSKKLDDVLSLRYTRFRTGRSALFSTVEILRGKRVSNEEVTYQKSSGERVYFLLNARPLYNKQKKIIGCLVILTDITAQKHTELKLRDSEKRLATFFQASPSGIFITRLADGLFIEVNEEFLRMIGYSAGETIGKTSADLHIWPNFADRERIVKDIYEQGRVDGVEIQLQHKSGKVSDFILSALPLEIGGEACILGSMTDITGRKQAENKIQLQNAILKGINRIFEATLTSPTEAALGQACLDVAAEITGSKFGFIGEVNESGLYDIAISNPAWEACKLIDESGHRRPPGRFTMHGIYGRVIKDGKGLFTNNPGSHPDRIGTPPGHPPLESFLGVPLMREGIVTGLVAVGNREGGYSPEQLEALESLAPAIEEAFSRKRAETALQKSESLIRTITDNSPDCIYMKDTDGRLLFANPSTLAVVGKSAEQVIGKTDAELYDDPAVSRAIMETDRRVISSNRMEVVEETVNYPDGERFFLSAKVPYHDVQGNVSGLIGISRDITERKQAEQDMKRLQMLLTEGQRIAHLGSWEYIAETQKTVWSEEEYRIYGIDPVGPSPEYQDMLRNNIHPDDASLLEQTFRQALRDRSVFELEHRIVRPDGSLRIVFDLAQPYFDDKGNLVKYMGATLDITERKLAEARLTADLNALTRMHALSSMSLKAKGLEPLLQEVIDTSVAIMGAERGTLQLLEGDSLRIVTHHGHQQPFLEYFASAENQASACGEALKHGERVIIPDIEESPVFAETPSLEVLRAAGVRAVQSTPMVSRAGELLGILTTQWGVPHSPDEHDLWRLDLLVRQTSDLIESTRAEQALIENEARFRALAEEMPHFVWEADADGIPLYANQRFLNYTGLSFEQAQGDGWLTAQHPEDAPKVVKAWKNAIKNHAEYDLETRFLDAASNEYRWFRVKGSPVRDQSGRLVRWVGTCTDIHDIRLAQEALRESEERLRLMGDNLPDSAVYQYVHEPDGRVRFLYFSAGIERLNGVSVEEVLRDAGVLHRQSPPEYLQQLIEAEARSARDMSDFDMELPMRRPDGQVRWMRLHSRPRRQADGRMIWDGVQIDITERKEAQEALRKSEQLYRAIGESIDYGVWTCAPDGRNTYASQSFLDMVGLTQQECADFGWGDVLHPDDAEHTIAAWQDCVRTGETWDIEHRFRGADGEWHPVLARGVPIRDEQGNITNWAGINLDISRLKETEEALLRSNQRFELLAETASRLLAAEQPQQIVEDICRKVMVYLDCHAFFNFLADEAAGRLHLNACAGIPAEEARKIEWLDYGVAVCGCAAAEGRRIVAENIFTTPDPRTELVKSYGIQAYACHPITGADERIIGTLSFGTRNRPTFTAEELELMKTVADQVAIAMERKQTGEKISQLNRELKHTVEELEAVFDTVPIGIAIAEDTQGYHIRGNPANEQLLGVMHGGELSLLPGLDRAPAGFRTLQNGRELAIEELPMQRAARGEIVTGQILDVVLQDGRVVNLYSNAAPLYDEQNRPRGAVGAFLDITDLRRAEEELRRAKDELELRVQERTAELAKTNEALLAENLERKKAHDIVVKQTRLLQAFFKSTITPLVFLDKNFNFIRVNEAYARACQREEQEFPGRNHFKLYPDEENQRIFEQVVATGEIYQAAARPFVFPDHPEWGITYWDWILTPLLNNTGEVESLVFSLSNVTERKRAEELVRESEARFKSLIQTASVVILYLSPEGTILEFNPEAELVYGRTREAVLGKNYLDLFIADEYRVRMADRIKRILNGEELLGAEMPIRHADGSRRYYLWNADRILDQQGVPYGIITVGYDITERKRMENDLESAARYSRSLIEASLDPLVTININGQIMDTNGATERITGLRREQLIGSDFSNYFTEPEKAKRGYEAVFRKGFVRNYPLVIKDVSGKTRDVLYNATVYRNKGGEVQGVFAAARDITKRKRAEGRLRESEERLKFLSSELISAQETERKRIASELHDSIASSLSAAILGLVRASRELPEGTHGHELITKVITMVQHTVEETRRMMNLLRPPMLDDLGLLPAITWFLDQYSAIYSGLTVNKDIAVEDAEIPESMKIDMYRIIQEAFTNIAKHSNASAAELSLKKKDDVIELTIADNGQGFNPDAGPAAKRGASGLGLISMKERAELAGGTMLIQSIAGKGTTVCARWSAGV